MESGSQDETNGDRTSLDRIMDKMSYRIEEHFGGLKSDISSLRHELNEEIENVRSTMKDVEKSLEAAWNVITSSWKMYVRAHFPSIFCSSKQNPKFTPKFQQFKINNKNQWKTPKFTPKFKQSKNQEKINGNPPNFYC